jgi:hypothetical protein
MDSGTNKDFSAEGATVNAVETATETAPSAQADFWAERARDPDNGVNHADLPVAAGEIRSPSVGGNLASKEELLSRAKAHIETGEQSMHDAAELLALAQQRHRATQREIASAVGKSEPYVSRLLQWRRDGYKDDSPFGPTTKAGRLAHAKARAGARPINPSKGGRLAHAKAWAAAPATNPRQVEAPEADGDADASAGKAGTDASTTALAEFKAAVDRLIPKMNYEAKVEATGYFHKKIGARVA